MVDFHTGRRRRRVRDADAGAVGRADGDAAVPGADDGADDGHADHGHADWLAVVFADAYAHNSSVRGADGTAFPRADELSITATDVDALGIASERADA